MHLTRQCSILLVAMGAVVLLVLRMMRSDEDDTNSSGAAYPAIVTPLLKELVLCLVPSDDFMYCTSRRRNDTTGVRVD
jgi:hypothetical protein